ARSSPTKPTTSRASPLRRTNTPGNPPTTRASPFSTAHPTVCPCPQTAPRRLRHVAAGAKQPGDAGSEGEQAKRRLHPLREESPICQILGKLAEHASSAQEIPGQPLCSPRMRGWPLRG